MLDPLRVDDGRSSSAAVTLPGVACLRTAAAKQRPSQSPTSPLRETPARTYRSLGDALARRTGSVTGRRRRRRSRCTNSWRHSATACRIATSGNSTPDCSTHDVNRRKAWRTAFTSMVDNVHPVPLFGLAAGSGATPPGILPTSLQFGWCRKVTGCKSRAVIAGKPVARVEPHQGRRIHQRHRVGDGRCERVITSRIGRR